MPSCASAIFIIFNGQQISENSVIFLIVNVINVLTISIARNILFICSCGFSVLFYIHSTQFNFKFSRKRCSGKSQQNDKLWSLQYILLSIFFKHNAYAGDELHKCTEITELVQSFPFGSSTFW